MLKFWIIFISCILPCDLDLLENVENKAGMEMNAQLTQAYTEDEVLLALKQMKPTKSPGPDGMTPLFYQSFWPTMGNDVSTSVKNAFSLGMFPSELNHTFIALISKKKNPELVSNYRLVSLSNVLYKILSKVLANRLKKIFPQIISYAQSAFVLDRLIIDTVLLEYELIHHLRQKQRGNRGFMSLKLDINKAYDKIEWSFLEVIMRKIGFNED